MPRKSIVLIGAPVDTGKRRPGCLMGPDAFRTAGIAKALTDLGHRVEDDGNLSPASHQPDSDGGRLFAPNATIAWTHRLIREADRAMKRGLPIFMGGDHSLSLGTVVGVANHAAEKGRPLYVLWLDAHSDYHTAETTTSGHLHGTPLAYATGRSGFGGFPKVENPVPQENICILGLRSVDAAERAALEDTDIGYHDMREIDEQGIARLLTGFLDRVKEADGMLHVSLDVDFLDPDVAPAVVTTVPGGTTIREGHLVMEILHDYGLMTSLDLVELNPFLDERGRTAQLMVDLAASALGRKVFDRPTRAHT